MSSPMRLPARLCWSLDAKPWVLLALDAAGALVFLLGCVVFYFPAQYSAGITLFLFGSLLMLLSVGGRAILRYGPSE